MASVLEVLSARVSLCLDCLTQRTSRRVVDVLRELEALPTIRFAEGRCTACTEVGPVLARR
jgi:hypothetical protein